jgi:very-short-patch-repair endonuclease
VLLPTQRLAPFLIAQDGAVTLRQAASVDVSPRELRTLMSHGWTRPLRGVYVQPTPGDPFRTSVRAAMLVSHNAAAYAVTAARFRELWGLPIWKPTETPQLIAPVAKTPGQRRGARTHYGIRPEETEQLAGFLVATLGHTVGCLASVLRLDDLICLVDSALRLGWDPEVPVRMRKGVAQLRRAVALADRRSESAFETRMRLLLIRAGLAPEELQWKLFNHKGVCYARLDFAWPSRMLAVEADGRETHDKPEALYGDRPRQNLVSLAGWKVLRFTWDDLVHRPDWIVSQVRQALSEVSISRSVR